MMRLMQTLYLACMQLWTAIHRLEWSRGKSVIEISNAQLLHGNLHHFDITLICSGMPSCQALLRLMLVKTWPNHLLRVLHVLQFNTCTCIMHWNEPNVKSKGWKSSVCTAWLVWEHMCHQINFPVQVWGDICDFLFIMLQSYWVESLAAWPVDFSLYVSIHHISSQFSFWADILPIGTSASLWWTLDE